MNDLSLRLRSLPVGCYCGDMVVNHLMYADDIVLLAPSGKGMQVLLMLPMIMDMPMILYSTL